MKIVILGNSHTAALKLGWEAMQEAKSPYAKSHSVTFFAARGKMLNDMRVIPGRRRGSGRMEPSNEKLGRSIAFTSGGKKTIDFNKFDVCLLHGMLLFPRYDHRTSSALRNAVLTKCSTNSLAATLAERIRKITNIPIFLTHQPMQVWDETLFRPTVDNFSPYQDVFKDIQDAFPHKDVTFIPQPLETLHDEVSTKENYTQGSIRLQVSERSTFSPHNGKDIVHMNGIFGEKQLTKIFESLK